LSTSAGTSYGVSLLWLLAAVTANEKTGAKAANDQPSLVIGTEYEPEKADRAIEHVKEAFEGQVPSCLQLLRGDLLKTLVEANLPEKSIDALLLDIWSPLTLPTLKIILPKLRVGAVVFADNTIASAPRYGELFGFIRDPANGFQIVTLPYPTGFDMCVYTG
jgi:predicted O-methyltransferase YrrM